MRGGGLITYEKLESQLMQDTTMDEFLQRYNSKNGKSVTTFDEFKTNYYRTATVITIDEIKELLHLEQGETSELAKSISNLQARPNDNAPRSSGPFRSDDPPWASSGYRSEPYYVTTSGRREDITDLGGRTHPMRNRSNAEENERLRRQIQFLRNQIAKAAAGGLAAGEAAGGLAVASAQAQDHQDQMQMENQSTANGE
jgi:hypothetical protein